MFRLSPELQKFFGEYPAFYDLFRYNWQKGYVKHIDLYCLPKESVKKAEELGLIENINRLSKLAIKIGAYLAS